MEIYKDNIKFLKKHYPELFTAIQGCDKQGTYEYSTTRNQEPNVIMIKDNTTHHLHSKYNAEEEAKRWSLSLDSEKLNSEHLLIIGCGLGYYLEQLVENSSAPHIYVYEPDLQIFNAWIQSRDIRKILLNSRIRVFVVGEHDLLQTVLTNQIASYAKSSLSIVYAPIYNKLFQQVISNVHYKIKGSLYSQLTNQATLEMFHQEWITNILYNLPYVMMSNSAPNLKGIVKGTSAIVVGSGPSLQYDIGYLQELKSKCLIIAAGSSIQALEHFGISPHLVVSIDGGLANFRVFENINRTEYPLLFCPQINYNIVDHYKAPLIAATLSHDSITPYFNQSGEIPIFRSSTSVTGTAIQVAAYMGASEIILMGQDLSYPGRQFYSEGIKHISEETMSSQLKDASEWVPNVDGGQNPTTIKMKATLDDIGLLIKLISIDGIRVINTSRHGAVIEGTEWVPMEHLNQQMNELPLSDFSINSYTQGLTSEEKTTNLNKLKSELQLMRIQTNDVGKRLKQLNTELANLPTKIVDGSVSSLNKHLIEVDKLWSKITRQKAFEVFYSFSLKQHINTYMKYVPEIVETEDVRKKSRLIVDHLGMLVQKMDNFTPDLLKILSDSMNRLDNIIDGLGEINYERTI